jgi:hypothetical protein
MSLNISKRELKVPAEIQEALRKLRKDMVTPWGEEVEDGIALHRHARQLACGFYYRWRWPDDRPDKEWLYARADWHRELREHLKRRVPGMDSPFLVGAAIARGELASDFCAAWCNVRDRYKPHPPVEAIWISDFLVADAVRWLEDTKDGPGIAWYEHAAIAQRLAARGVQAFGAGLAASKAIIDAANNPRPIAASIFAHGVGKNLQTFSRNLILSCPSGGAVWQQLLGRTHRVGQEADEVTAEVYQHTDELCEAWQTALRTAIYQEHTAGDRHKLLLATKVGLEELEPDPDMDLAD